MISAIYYCTIAPEYGNWQSQATSECTCMVAMYDNNGLTLGRTKLRASLEQCSNRNEFHSTGNVFPALI